MACFLLRGPAGERWMAEHENYRLLEGEAIVPGAINWNCGPRAVTLNPLEGVKFRKCSKCGAEDGVYEST